MSWRGWRLDTLCVPDGGDTVYEVEGDGVGGRGHGLWREGFVRREGNYHDGGEIIRRSNKWRWRDDVEFSPSKITTTTHSLYS